MYETPTKESPLFAAAFANMPNSILNLQINVDIRPDMDVCESCVLRAVGYVESFVNDPQNISSIATKLVQIYSTIFDVATEAEKLIFSSETQATILMLPVPGPLNGMMFSWETCLQKFVFEQFMLKGCCSSKAAYDYVLTRPDCLVKFKNQKSNFGNYLAGKFIENLQQVKFVCKGGRGSGGYNPDKPHKTGGYLEFSGPRSNSVNGKCGLPLPC